MIKLLSIIIFMNISSSSNAQVYKKDQPGKGKNESLIADGAHLKRISDRFGFTEGPATDKAGNIYFTDQPNNRIWKYNTSGVLSIFMEPSGRPNGMYMDTEGNLIVCADEHNQLWSITPNKKITILLNDYHGQRLNGPNDVWVNKDETIYITDPYYQRPYWTRKRPEINGENVYMLKKNSRLEIVEAGLEKPNGIIGSADGKYLFVADIQGNKTYQYTILPDGHLADRKLFIEKGSDGMTIDEKGNVYLTDKGVFIYNFKGEFLEHIDVPEEWTGNLTFGGKDHNMLFITASKSIYTIQMKVRAVD
jgi:gluconolactonase